LQPGRPSANRKAGAANALAMKKRTTSKPLNKKECIISSRRFKKYEF